MKKLYTAVAVMIGAVFIATFVLLLLSPDTVPVHYNFAGQPDRFGSKYEFLLFPGEAIAIGAFFVWMAKRHRQNPTDEKALLISGISILSVLGFLGIYFQIEGIRYDPSAITPLELQIVQLTFMAIGILFVVLGNILPKTSRNHTFGLRTKWSLASNTVWQKSQRFAGISMVICGGVMMICCMTKSPMLCMVLCTGLTLIWGIVCAVVSYMYYKEENRE